MVQEEQVLEKDKEEPKPASTDEKTDFDELFDFTNSGGEEEEVPQDLEPPEGGEPPVEEKKEEEKVEEPPKPETPPAPEEKVEPSEAQPPPEQPKEPEKPAEETPPQPPPQRPEAATPEQIAKVREDMQGVIANNYALSDEQLSEMEENPKEFWPKTIGRLYVDVFEAVYGTLMSQMPQLVGGQIQKTSVRKEAAEQFFQRWPKLKDQKFGQQIAHIAQTYMQINPQCTRKQLIESVGAQVSVINGLPLQQGEEAPPAPAPPAQTTFVPPNPGAARAPARAKPQGPTNPFEEMSTWEEEM